MSSRNKWIASLADNDLAFSTSRNFSHLSRLLIAASIASLIAIPAEALANSIDIKRPADARAQGLDSLHLAVKNDGGVPTPSNLADFIKDKRAAVQLGKALFWDMQVGSDGVQACASCHFHAGADNRSVGQLNPNLGMLLDTREDDITGYFNSSFLPDTNFELKGVNAKVQREDFPLVKFIQSVDQPGDGTVRPVTGNSNDIMGSMGIFASTFDGIQLGSAKDLGMPLIDPVFHGEDGAPIRQTVTRNAPSVINAVFNFTNFWDGRANPVFNGNDHFGNQNPFSGIFVNGANGLEIVQIALDNASLASQTLGPPASTIEMSYGDPYSANRRDFIEIGRKLLGAGPDGKPLAPLGQQQVHPFDSTLGRLSNFPQPGLKTDYATLIKKAFAEKYWNSTQLLMRADGVKLTQMEVNFSVFFGLAVQLYESTLVADRTPFDWWMESGRFNPYFGPDELAGLNVFVNEGACIQCHAGPELTKASIRAAQSGTAAIRAMNAAQGTALYDAGFYNVGITPTTDDLGRGDRDPILGQPLAFSRQSLFQRLQFNPMGFPIFGDDTLPAVAQDSSQAVCDDNNDDGICGADENITPEFQRVTVDGAFKTPGLRNVELTGPYFHNGGVATLRQVVQFYNRGGNFCNFNAKDLDANIKPLDLTEQQEQQLVAFLVSLTDPRVKYQTAPFDHPELRLPANGLDAYGQKRLQPVGAWGSFTGLKTFLNLDPQDAIFTPEGVCTITP